MKQLKASILWINGSSDSTKNEYASTEALVKISQDMARVLD